MTAFAGLSLFGIARQRSRSRRLNLRGRQFDGRPCAKLEFVDGEIDSVHVCINVEGEVVWENKIADRQRRLVN
ncbi:MAG TPA: hypothetical protein VGM17_17375 [Rhizomicrobium sp.]|jgi:hypothetical protein